MAVKQPGVWGIDLGQCALKAIRLEKVDGQVTATAFDYIEHLKILSQPDADPDQLIRDALERFLSRNEHRGDLIAISVPGQSGLSRFVKLPPVEEKKITDIVRFEAKQQIPFPLDEVVWDFQKIGQGEVTDGFALETEIGLFAMKRDLVNRYLQHFKDVNVEVHLVQMAPLALCNFVGYDLLTRGEEGEEEAEEDEETAGKKQCIVGLDIGADSSNLVITDGDKIIWQRPIPLGGNHFTRALTKDLKLTFAKAEHLKRNAVKSPDLRKILAALKPVLNDFVSEVQRSLGYFTNTHRDAHVKYMIGLGNAFRLPGLQKYLQEKLQLEVKKLSKLNRLSGEEVTAAPQFKENLASFGVAYGLALQGLGEPRLQTNLLPHEIRLERLVRAKKPWAAAAAAALILAVAGLTFGRAREWGALTNSDVAKALNEGKRVYTSAEKIKKEFGEKAQELADNDKAVKVIAAGVDERFNWNLFTRYVNDALPQPYGNMHLTEVARSSAHPKAEYDTKDATGAYNEWLNKQLVTQGAKVLKADQERKLDLFIKQNLIQINVEGINQLWSDDLTPFYKKIREDAKEDEHILDGLEAEERTDLAKETPEKLPKSGWVVEIRGSTFHKGGANFIRDTLVENLARPEMVGNTYEAEAKKLDGRLKELDKGIAALKDQIAKASGKPEAAPEAGSETKKEVKKVDAKQKAALDALHKQLKVQEQIRNDVAQQWSILHDMQEGVRKRVSFTILYRAVTIKPGEPSPGSVLPVVLGTTSTAGPGGGGTQPPGGQPPAGLKMPKGIGAGSGPPSGGAMPPSSAPTSSAPSGSGEDTAKEGPSRAGWVPLGEIAASTLASGSGGLGGFGPGLKGSGTAPPPALQQPNPSAATGGTTPPAPTTESQAPRTEFSVLLIWREPLPPGEETPASSDTSK
jgi:type IV pilus assembly protein PilM